MLAWEDFNLKGDPFATVPSKGGFVWADREVFRRQLKEAFRRSLLSTPSRIIACIWGGWGAGKTHAMNYFSQPEAIKQLIDEMELKVQTLPISIPIIFPMGDVVNTVYLEMVEQIGVDRIIQALNKIESKFESIRTKEVFLEEVSRYMDSRVAEAFVTLKGKKRLTLDRYLSMTATSTELRDAGIARGISTSTDKVRTISGILNLITGTIASRVFLWFDDLERVGEIPGRDIFQFSYFIRDLLDNVPNNLLIIFNFTLYPGEKIEDRIAYLGPAILSRISDIITVQPMSKEDFIVYVRDLLSQFRLKPSEEELDEFFPFEKAALEFIFSELKRRLISIEPRRVNQVLSSALDKAINDVKRTDPVITQTYIEGNLEDIFSKIAFQK